MSGLRTFVVYPYGWCFLLHANASFMLHPLEEKIRNGYPVSSCIGRTRSLRKQQIEACLYHEKRLEKRQVFFWVEDWSKKSQPRSIQRIGKNFQTSLQLLFFSTWPPPPLWCEFFTNMADLSLSRDERGRSVSREVSRAASRRGPLGNRAQCGWDGCTGW